MPEKQYWGYNSIGVNSMGSIMATVVLASTVIPHLNRNHLFHSANYYATINASRN